MLYNLTGTPLRAALGGLAPIAKSLNPKRVFDSAKAVRPTAPMHQSYGAGIPSRGEVASEPR